MRDVFVLFLSDCGRRRGCAEWSMSESRSMEIRVSIVEDDEGLRDTLSRYVTTRGFHCASTHPSTEDALRLLPGIKPDVVLMDINLPRKSGIECVRELKSLIPTSKCIILTAFEDAELIFQALSAGALGCAERRPVGAAAGIDSGSARRRFTDVEPDCAQNRGAFSKASQGRRERSAAFGTGEGSSGLSCEGLTLQTDRLTNGH